MNYIRKKNDWADWNPNPLKPWLLWIEKGC